MRVLLRVGLCLLVASSMMAQRRGGIGGGGGVRGGGVGGFRGGTIGGGFRGGTIGGFRGGFNGFRGFNEFRGFNGFRGGFRTGFFGGFGFGYGYPYSLYPYGYDPYWDYYEPAPYISTYPSYPVYDYNTSPNVTVVYPAAPQANNATYNTPVQPVVRNYDQYGQEVGGGANASSSPGSSPIYLIATKDQVIRAAASYWVTGNTLHYVTLQREEKQVPLDTLDRSMTLQLNRERRVPMSLPQ